MKNKIIFLLSLFVFMSLVFLTLPSFAQSEYQYTESESITCGNGICEEMRFQLNKGEEKAVDIAGKMYNFKFIEIRYTRTEEGKVLSYSAVITVNGEEMTGTQTGEKYGFWFHPIGTYEEYTSVKVREAEVRGCEVPDCRFRVELDLYKKWNLIPIYFLEEKALERGTCQFKDFLVSYAYIPVKNDYVKLHTQGKSFSDFESSIAGFRNIGESEKILVGYSVWIYSLNECKLVAELPNTFENLLMVMEDWKERGAAKFASGWNFWIGSTDMQGKSFDEIKGSCTIEKAYTFDASSQSWKVLTTPPGPAANFIFKVKDACMFGVAEAAPPEIPE